MEILSRNQILSKVGVLKREELDIPEWGGSVILRELTAIERDQIETMLVSGKAKNNYQGVRARTMALACVNETGDQVFTEKDIPMLGQLSGKTLNDVFKKVSDMSGMTAEAEQELEKNSPETESV